MAMRMRLGVVAAAALMVAGPAGAAVYEINLAGKILSQVNPGTDPNISVGDTIKLTAKFDDTVVGAIGDYKVAGTHLGSSGNVILEKTGLYFLRIELNDLSWGARDDPNDGWGPAFFNSSIENYQAGNLTYSSLELSGISVIMKDGKVVGLGGSSNYIYPADSGAPALSLESVAVGYEAQYYEDDCVYSSSCPEGFEPIPVYYSDGRVGPLSNDFSIFNVHAHGNEYDTPGFKGAWDFTGSTILADGRLLGAPVPEPATWAMMLIGFGGVGAALRRRPSLIKARHKAGALAHRA